MATLNAGKIVAALKLQTKQWDKAMKQVQKDLKDADKRAKKFRKDLVKLGKSMAVAGAAFAAAGVLMARSFIRAADTAEQYQLRLATLLRSQEKGNRLFESMAKFASGVAFEFEQILGGATQLAGVMGGSVEEVQRWMPLITDLAAATGFTIQETVGQVIRMYSAGAASADLFRERGILTMLGFQAGVKVSAEDTRKLLMKSWKSTESQFRGTAAKLAGTWTGLMSMLADKWFLFRRAVLEKTGVWEDLKDQVSDLNDSLGEMIKNLEKWIVLNPELSSGILKVSSSVVLLTGSLVAIGVGMRGLVFVGRGLALLVNPIGAILSAVAALGIAIGVAFKQISRMDKALRDGTKSGEAMAKSLALLSEFPHLRVVRAITKVETSVRGLGRAAIETGKAFDRMRSSAAQFKPPAPIEIALQAAKVEAGLASLGERVVFLRDEAIRGKMALDAATDTNNVEAAVEAYKRWTDAVKDLREIQQQTGSAATGLWEQVRLSLGDLGTAAIAAKDKVAGLLGTVKETLLTPPEPPPPPEGFAEGFQQGIANVQMDLEQMGKTGMQVASSLVDAFSTGLGNAMAGLITGTQTVGEAFKNMGLAIINIITQIIAKLIVMAALNAAFPGLGTAAGSFLAGTESVPSTGLFKLHEGETVISRGNTKTGAKNVAGPPIYIVNLVTEDDVATIMAGHAGKNVVLNHVVKDAQRNGPIRQLIMGTA